MSVAVAAVSASGCDRIEKALTPDPVVTHVTVAPKVAQPGARIQGELKPGAPSNLPLWEGANVMKSKVVKSRLGTSWSATLSTSDPYDDVVKGMAVGFERSGWQVESQAVPSTEGSTTVLTVTEVSASGMVTVAAQKDETTQIGYVISSAGE